MFLSRPVYNSYRSPIPRPQACPYMKRNRKSVNIRRCVGIWHVAPYKVEVKPFSPPPPVIARTDRHTPHCLPTVSAQLVTESHLQTSFANRVLIWRLAAPTAHACTTTGGIRRAKRNVCEFASAKKSFLSNGPRRPPFSSPRTPPAGENCSENERKKMKQTEKSRREICAKTV